MATNLKGCKKLSSSRRYTLSAEYLIDSQNWKTFIDDLPLCSIKDYVSIYILSSRSEGYTRLYSKRIERVWWPTYYWKFIHDFGEPHIELSVFYLTFFLETWRWFNKMSWEAIPTLCPGEFKIESVSLLVTLWS